MATDTKDKTESPEARPQAASTVAAWEKNRTHKGVTLPSGTVVDIQLPDLPTLAKAGEIPNELLEAAGTLQKAIDEGDRSDVTVETLANIATFMEFLLPQMILKPKITTEDVGKLPPEDKELLVAFAQRARDIDAVGRHLAGLEQLAEWRRFRGWEPSASDLGG